MQTQEPVTAVIPAKGFSSRVPKKNSRPFFNDESLLALKIRQLLRTDVFAEIIVDSDDEEMLALAKRLGVVAVKRPDALSAQDTPFGHVIAHGASIASYDTITYCFVTTPFIRPEDYRSIVRNYLAARDGKSLVTAEVVQKHFLNGQGRPLNFGVGEGHIYSENLEKVWVLKAGVFVWNRQLLSRARYFMGESTKLFELDKTQSIDIDGWDDWSLAQTIAQAYGLAAFGLG